VIVRVFDDVVVIQNQDSVRASLVRPFERVGNPIPRRAAAAANSTGIGRRRVERLVDYVDEQVLGYRSQNAFIQFCTAATAFVELIQGAWSVPQIKEYSLNEFKRERTVVPLDPLSVPQLGKARLVRAPDPDPAQLA
jgi:hypothetical protein